MTEQQARQVRLESAAQMLRHWLHEQCPRCGLPRAAVDQEAMQDARIDHRRWCRFRDGAPAHG